jgi:uncharacterized membrane-anchored protein YhcB (DUF1043 family)
MEVVFKIGILAVIGFFVGRVYEFRIQDNYRKKYEKLNKKYNELKRNLVEYRNKLERGV